MQTHKFLSPVLISFAVLQVHLPTSAQVVVTDPPVINEVTIRRQIPGPGSSFRANDRRPAADATFEGYDFGHVVDRLETSVDPLEQEMDSSFKQFVESVEVAEQLLEEGNTQQAVEKCATAIDGVLDARDRVLKPMWDGQEFLIEQISKVRSRLAKAVSVGEKGKPTRLSRTTEVMLDNIARRIAGEDDPLRKKRLIAHYRTVRSLAHIRRYAMQLSPDQRKLWSGVLRVLEEAALAHQQVLMGSEALFAQFEASSANLREFLTLLDTVDGATRLTGLVRGLDGNTTGMTEFAAGMGELRERLSGFNTAVDGAIQSKMFELEAQVDALQPASGDEGSGVMPADVDNELADRIERIESLPVVVAPRESPQKSPRNSPGNSPRKISDATDTERSL